MIIVPIEGTGTSISIEVLGYENAAARNTSDANWLRSRIRIEVGPFSGETEVTLTTQDFIYFKLGLTEVLRSLQGKAIFETDEDRLRIEVEMGPRGTATVSGTAKADGGPQASLIFSFETDQSYLADTERALVKVVESFPIQQRIGS